MDYRTMAENQIIFSDIDEVKAIPCLTVTESSPIYLSLGKDAVNDCP